MAESGRRYVKAKVFTTAKSVCRFFTTAKSVFEFLNLTESKITRDTTIRQAEPEADSGQYDECVSDSGDSNTDSGVPGPSLEAIEDGGCTAESEPGDGDYDNESDILCDSESDWEPGSSACVTSCSSDSDSEAHSGTPAAPCQTPGPTDCTSKHLSGEDNINVTVKATCKKHCCKFCGKMNSKMSTHLSRVHKLEPEVKEILGLPKGICKSTARPIARLVALADYSHAVPTWTSGTKRVNNVMLSCSVVY
ncbi:hypothetical protein BaRGS_00004662 [Batillaria attramentaria]|uniref:C2H2-type domain-containing protein n=1 Tax=Batillaria attramentaria TaxID=370345 RepID=A0ABD0LWB8_9CAEN